MEHIRVNEHTRLETLKISMASTIFEAIDTNRDFLKKWLSFVETTKKTGHPESFVKSITNQPREQRNEVYGIWHNEIFAGLIGFNSTDWQNKKTEIGYWLIEKMQGKGIATNCTEKLVRYAFQKLKLNRIAIKTAVGNHKSAAVPKRLGFVFESVERCGEIVGAKYLDLEIYSLLKADLYPKG